jgi:acyl-CoA synthetase (AMP-forming)/AMP-acid ligase II
MALIEYQRASQTPAFVAGLAEHGSRAALVTADGALTYAELDERVREVTERLGVNRRLVLLQADNSTQAIVNYMAALRGGHPVLLAAPDNDVALRRLIDAYDPDVLMSGATPEPDARRAETVHDLHPDLAVLLSTSGSTGSPKLVRLSPRNLESNAAAISDYLQLTPDDRAVTSLPLHYCYGLSVLNSHLAAGASLVLTDLSVVDTCFWELLRSTGATSFAGVPHTFDLLDRAGFANLSLPTLRYVTQAGGKMAPATVRRYAELGARSGWELFVMYGQTEATARMAYLPPALAAVHPETIGVPVPGGTLTVDSPDERGVGELVYRGDNVMLGYAHDAGDLALGATVSELHTGDLGRVTGSGLYEIVGRTSRFVKLFGLRIDLDAVERRLAEHGFDAACVGDDNGLTIAVEAPGDAARAAALVSQDLGLPRSYVQVHGTDRLPRLPGGKKNYAAVRTHGAGQPAAAPEPPRPLPSSERGEAVRSVFVDVLGVEPRDEDSFVSLGGDSLSYVEMSICLEGVLGELPRDWHTTPVGDLAPKVGRKRLLARTDTSAVVRAVSIVLIVGTHAKLWQVTGGAHALLFVAGFNFARFQLRSSSALASVARVAIPSMCWISVVAAVSNKYGWPNALLINGLVNRPGDQWGYWFLEALIQILLPLTALFAVPAVARLEARRPFAIATAAVGAGLLFRFDLIELSHTFPIARPHEVLWLFALGWAAARASSWRGRLLVSVVAAVAVPGFFETLGRSLVVLGALALVTWTPSLPLPRLAQRVVAPLAGASLYIYLTHFQVYPPLMRFQGPLLAVIGSLVAGVVAGAVARRLIDRVERAARALRARRVSPRRARPFPALTLR